MQLAFSSIDALQDGASPIAGDQKSRAMWFTGIGTGGPAITAGVMLLLNKIALALFTGLGPIFILCLLFDQTKQLFSRWLFYGVGTMFSLGVLSVMVALALKVVKAVSIAFWVTTFIGGSNEGVNSMAMQQGGEYLSKCVRPHIFCGDRKAFAVHSRQGPSVQVVSHRADKRNNPVVSMPKLSGVGDHFGGELRKISLHLSRKVGEFATLIGNRVRQILK